jgi:hypothetical protein
MTTLKHNGWASLMRPGFIGRAMPERLRLGLPAIRVFAACVLILQFASLVYAGDPPPVNESATQIVSAPKPAYTPKGHQMERYKDFARQAKMPTIAITNAAVIEVGGIVKTDLKRLGRLSDSEKAALASQFGLPADVIGKLMDRATTNSALDPEQVAQNVRTAVVDYKFLQQEWGQYHPPAEGQKVKADALAALQAGDVTRAWELYDGLQRPAPPTGLRIISQP